MIIANFITNSSFGKGQKLKKERKTTACKKMLKIINIYKKLDDIECILVHNVWCHYDVDVSFTKLQH